MTTEEINNVNKTKAALELQLADIKKLTGINSLLLSVCFVDTLAGFYCGYDGKTQGGNKKRYEKFVDKYLASHKSYIYDVRCNLTHSFSNTVANFMFVDNPEFSKVFGTTVSILNSPIFNIDKFKVDLESAFNTYFNDLLNNSESNIQVNFHTRFNGFGILQDGVIGTVRNLKGEIINHIDQADTMPGLNLKIVSFDPTKIKQ